MNLAGYIRVSILRMASIRIAVLSLAVAALVFGCSSSKQTRLMREAAATGMTADELQIRVHDLAMRGPGIIEEASYRIQVASSDIRVQRNAMLWRIHAVPAFHQSVFQIDPYIGLIDTWVLTAQMVDYFEAGSGKDAFGELQPIAIGASRYVEAEIKKVARRAWGTSEGFSSAETEVWTWARDHPLESPVFARESVIGLVADLLAESEITWYSGLDTIEESIRDLAARSTVYTGHIPRQIQWQIDLAILELKQSGEVNTALGDLEGISTNTELISASIADNLEMTAGSIDNFSAALSGQFALTEESIMAGVREERVAVMDGISKEREAATKDVERIMTGALGDIEVEVRGLVDYAFIRALLLLVIFFIGLILYRLVASRLTRQRAT